MNEIVEQTAPAGGERDGLQRVGATLKAERESQKLSIEEIGERLRLTPATLVAIESGRADELPSMTFIRGYVRSYARLLKLDEQSLLALLGEATAPIPHSTASRPFTVTPRMRHVPPGGRGKWLGKALLALAVVAVLVAGWRVGGRLFSSLGTADSDSPQLALPDLGGQSTESASPPDGLDAIADTAEPEQDVAEDEVAPPAEHSAVEPSGTAVLRIHCDKPSWIEVTVAGHKQLSEQVPAGQTRSVEGNPPFDVLIGNVQGVAVDYEGVEIDLAPFTRGKVARFTLGE